ncbi:hypothetical protein DXX93_12300 [Thalassotalea euphylliae]|uniref:Uncharacterized protein n=1 Tax=Thalassotalea euphylliae TaxID=1655234 RepID=A0A3E0TRL2_9GAMM|nr:hypothetical protein [Thalassotalea euphylliae]REL27271.1 hypothetical protein DXX93_12300 [Thalassotalea euphylliae]
MLKEQQALLARLITEIESTITTEQCRVISDKYKAPTRAVWTVDHKLVLDNQCLPVELINELEFLLQEYGQELMDYINSSCPPLPLAAAISSFVFNKEKAKFSELQSKLNPSKEPDKIKAYKLSDYLILGYQFYDALFFSLYHSQPLLTWYWGVPVKNLFDKPAYKNKGADSKVKYKPNKLKYLC